MDVGVDRRQSTHRIDTNRVASPKSLDTIQVRTGQMNHASENRVTLGSSRGDVFGMILNSYKGSRVNHQKVRNSTAQNPTAAAMNQVPARRRSTVFGAIRNAVPRMDPTRNRLVRCASIAKVKQIGPRRLRPGTVSSRRQATPAAMKKVARQPGSGT